MNCNVVATLAEILDTAVVDGCTDDEGVGFSLLASAVGSNVCEGFDVITVGATDVAIATDGENDKESADSAIVGADEGFLVAVATDRFDVGVSVGAIDGNSVVAVDGVLERSPLVTAILLGSTDGVSVAAAIGKDEGASVVAAILLGSTDGVSMTTADADDGASVVAVTLVGSTDGVVVAADDGASVVGAMLLGSTDG